MVVYTKSGVTVNCCGNLLIASDGKTYNLCGRMLTCSGKIISYLPIERRSAGYGRGAVRR